MHSSPIHDSPVQGVLGECGLRGGYIHLTNVADNFLYFFLDFGLMSAIHFYFGLFFYSYY